MSELSERIEKEIRKNCFDSNNDSCIEYGEGGVEDAAISCARITTQTNIDLIKEFYDLLQEESMDIVDVRNTLKCWKQELEKQLVAVNDGKR